MPRKGPKNPHKLVGKQPLQSTAYQELARLLHQRSDELGLSVRDLVERLGRPRTTIHKTLTGQRRLDPIEFLDWCDALEWDDPVGIIQSLRQAR